MHAILKTALILKRTVSCPLSWGCCAQPYWGVCRTVLLKSIGFLQTLLSVNWLCCDKHSASAWNSNDENRDSQIQSCWLQGFVQSFMKSSPVAVCKGGRRGNWRYTWKVWNFSTKAQGHFAATSAEFWLLLAWENSKAIKGRQLLIPDQFFSIFCYLVPTSV